MKTAEDVAKEIIDDINEQIQYGLTTHTRNNVHVRIQLNRKQLRILSNRTHIRYAFISELVDKINSRGTGLTATYSSNIDAVSISDSLFRNDQVCTINIIRI